MLERQLCVLFLYADVSEAEYTFSCAFSRLSAGHTFDRWSNGC